MFQEYDFVLQYRPGNINDNVNALSRIAKLEYPGSNLNPSHTDSHYVLTELSRSLPTMEEIRNTQTNNPVLGKVQY